MILHQPYNAYWLLVIYIFSNLDLITSVYYHNREFIKTYFPSQQ